MQLGSSDACIRVSAQGPLHTIYEPLTSTSGGTPPPPSTPTPLLWTRSMSCFSVVICFADCGTGTCVACASNPHHLTRAPPASAGQRRGQQLAAPRDAIQFDDCHFFKHRRCRIRAFKSRTCTNVIRNFHKHRALRSVARLTPLSSSVIRACNFIFQPRVALPARKQHEP